MFDETKTAQLPGIGLGANSAASFPAICAAMADEADAFRKIASVVGEAIQVGGATFQRLVISGAEVLLVQSQIGLVNAGVAATIAVTQFGANVLLSAGSAGGMGKEVRVGDIIIGQETLYTFADATAFGGYVLGQIPKLPPRFMADNKLCVVAEATKNSVVEQAPNRRLDKRQCPQPTIETSQLHTGLIISSDAFIWEKNFAQVSANFPTALASDMETAAIAQVAYLFDIPWLAIRAISDLCGPIAADDFQTHLDNAAALSAQYVQALISNQKD